jgi:hypothetical protein
VPFRLPFRFKEGTAITRHLRQSFVSKRGAPAFHIQAIHFRPSAMNLVTIVQKVMNSAEFIGHESNNFEIFLIQVPSRNWESAQYVQLVGVRLDN